MHKDYPSSRLGTDYFICNSSQIAQLALAFILNCFVGLFDFPLTDFRYSMNLPSLGS